MVCDLLQVTCNWNIPDTIIQIAASILGAFLGFIFAINVSKLDSKKQNDEHIMNLYNELSDFNKSENIEKLKKNVLNVEDVKIINLPFLERTIDFNLCYTILGASTLKKLKCINSTIEQINYLFIKKNDYYFEHALELSDIVQSDLDLSADTKRLMTDSLLKNKYIAYNKAIYSKLITLFNDFNEKNVLNELQGNKKIQKIIKAK